MSEPTPKRKGQARTSRALNITQQPTFHDTQLRITRPSQTRTRVEGRSNEIRIHQNDYSKKVDRETADYCTRKILRWKRVCAFEVMLHDCGVRLGRMERKDKRGERNKNNVRGFGK